MRTRPTPRSLARRAALASGSLICAAALACPAGAAATTLLSSNWAGYVARPRSGAGFTSVSATWTAPAATCTTGRVTHSAVWVGLGGYATNASALEQIGTEADCTAGGRPVYSTWVELLPAAAENLSLPVSPGDRVTASVTVIGRHATLRLRDLTTGRRWSKTRRLANVDVSSAEWIVEAPSGCSANGACTTLALSDFGSVAFSGASATAAGTTRSAASPSWQTTALLLRQDAVAAAAGSGAPTLVSATPSSLAGGSFTVAFEQAAGASAPEAPTLPGFSGGPGGP